MDNRLPILIVGAGPTGLSMAAILIQLKIPFRIIDKAIKPTTTSNALAVQPRTLEMWDDLGLLNRVLTQGSHIEGLGFYGKGKPLGSLSTSRLKTMYPFMLGLSQHLTEEMYLQYLQENGVSIEFETALENICQTSDKVSVNLQKNDNITEELQVAWVIACDGGHSTVRDVMRLPCTGKSLTQYFVMGDLELDSTLPKNKVSIFFNTKGNCVAIPFDNSYFRVLFEVSGLPEFAQHQQPSDDQIIKLFQERCPIEAKIKQVLWTSGFTIREKIISRYRVDRVFFAGDAAHLHSPAGGQGMNTGLQDTYNLAWKLAAVIKGEANYNILDSYQLERQPVAKAVIERATLLTKLGATDTKFFNYLRHFMMPLIFKSPLGEKFMTTNSQLAINYRDSRLSKECIKPTGPYAGERLLDCWLDDEKTTRLMDFIGGQKPAILMFTGVLRDSRLTKLMTIQQEIAARYGDLFRYFVATVTDEAINQAEVTVIKDHEQRLHRKYQVTTPVIYFIRPDKYFGFRGRISDATTLMNYLQNIFIAKVT